MAVTINGQTGVSKLVGFTGSVAAFPTEITPEGFLSCDGSEVSRDTYQGLFEVVGTTFGAGDAFTTFNLPDLRGEFIRGWGKDTGRNLGSVKESSVVPSTPSNGLNTVDVALHYCIKY